MTSDTEKTRFLRRPGSAPASSDALPEDLAGLVFRRIILLCLIAAGMVVLGSVLCVGDFLIENTLFRSKAYSPFEATTDILMLAFSLGVAWTVHRRLLPDRALTTLGLAFGVVAAAWNCIGECWSMAFEPFPPAAYFSFTQAWVVFFPAIVPLRLRTTWIMIVAAAALAPISRLVTQQLGLVELPGDSLPILSILMGFSAIMGMTVSHVVYKLGRSVKAARELGSYTLERSLGGGGMGEVWVASHRLLARPAAVKLIKPDVLAEMDPGDVETLNRRFEQEVQATAQLRSPHTVEIYDYGVSREGAFYYVMELLDGIDLETLVRRYGAVEPARCARLLEQACHSLHEAHRRQLIHRDIKPANLFVCRYGEDVDFVKVLDFGLVKRGRDERDADPKLTADGSVTGTPAYLYPEAISGASAVDARSDLYSLGCVAYWLLTGALVFEGRTVADMLVRHATAAPEPPSERSELEIPPELDRLVLDCLAKDPADRPQSAAELAERLRAIAFARPWDAARARAWWDAHRAG